MSTEIVEHKATAHVSQITNAAQEHMQGPTSKMLGELRRELRQERWLADMAVLLTLVLYISRNPPT